MDVGSLDGDVGVKRVKEGGETEESEVDVCDRFTTVRAMMAITARVRAIRRGSTR